MTLTILYIPELFGFGIEVYVILTLIAIPTFFFWKWLLKKFIRTDRIRQITTWAATVIVTPIVYAGLIMLLIFVITYTPSKDFEKSQWLKDKEGRFEMAKDIINSKLLMDKDTIQVKQILGEPTWGSDTNWRLNKINSWTYNMGMGGGGLGFMFHHLVIKFEKQKVIAVEHVKIHD